MLLGMVLFAGYCMGSFIAMLSYRYPKILLVDHPEDVRLTLSVPRSHCPHCQHSLRMVDNIPLLSYLWLRGRCRYCRKAIGRSYLLTELVTLMVTIWVYYLQRQQAPLDLWGTLLFSWGLLALAAIDWRSGLLPDGLTLGLLWLGLLFQILVGRVPLEAAVLGAVLGYTLLWTLFQLHYLCTKREGMGYGDFKLAAAIGAWVGWYHLLSVLWLASVISIGAFVAHYLVHRKKRGARREPVVLPFGPYLAIAGWIFFVQPIPELIQLLDLFAISP